MNTLKVRDLINVGVFTVIYFVVMFGSGMIGLVGPWAMFIGTFVGLMLNGIVIMLYLSRVPKFGAMTLLGLLVGVPMAASQSYWTLIGLVLFGFLADIIQSQAGRAKKISPTRAQLAYAVFCLWGVFPLAPIFLDADGYFADVASGYGADYAAGMRAIFQPWVIIVWQIVIFFLALIAARMGTRVAHKHFTRAGVATAA